MDPVPMTAQLPPEQFSLIRKAGRAERIRNIRRRVAIGGAILAAIFSGTILLRSRPAPTAADATPVTTASTDVQASGNGGEGQESGIKSLDTSKLAEAAVAVVSSAALNSLLGDEGDSSDDEDSGSAPSLSTSQS